jgi:membrane fusion protein (multidrug efflux system)
MKWTRLCLWACGLAALGGAVASHTVQAQAPPSQPAPPKNDRDAEVEALKKEIEALRKKVDALGKKEAQPEPKPQKIVMTSPVLRDMVITQQYAARIYSRNHINICARFNGTITEVFVKEGQAVKKDDVLFKMSSTLLQAKLDVELANAQISGLEYESTKRLFEGNPQVVSQRELTIYKAKQDLAKASVKRAEAELSFATIKAPCDGIIGRLDMQMGSTVKEGEAITTLSDNSLMWVRFEVPESRYLEDMAELGEAKSNEQVIGSMNNRYKVELELADRNRFPQIGKIASIGKDFNRDNGNMLFRADFPNPDRLLYHGMNGKVLLHQTLKNAIVIPKSAAVELFGGRYVYVVEKDDVVRGREIDIQDEMNGLLVVKKGLGGLGVNDRIVLEAGRYRVGEKSEFEFRKPEDVIGNSKTK